MSPGRNAARVNNIRYAVSHDVGKQAACSNVSEAGFGIRLRRGTAILSASVPGKRSDRSERRGSSVSSPSPASGSAMTAWMITSLPSASIPAPSQPRIIGSNSGRSPTPFKLQMSWWFNAAARSVTSAQPSGTSGSDTSPSVRPARGFSASKDVAVTANIQMTVTDSRAIASSSARTESAPASRTITVPFASARTTVGARRTL
ncbi:unannotated protein [freshwater metagenome]|uniref:Unannotated protein n=1 Tax=freshwater metagenome TaxID=449393 RepID=A0A6J6L7Y5_9ZZZZ